MIMRQSEYETQYFRKAVRTGKTLAEIAKENNMPEMWAYHKIAQWGLLAAYREKNPAEEIPSQIKKEIREKYRTLINEGYTLREIAQRLHVSKKIAQNRIYQARLISLYRQYHPLPLQFDRNIQYRTYDGLEALVARGLSQKAMGKHFGVSHQRMKEVLLQHNMYATWKSYRAKKR